MDSKTIHQANDWFFAHRKDPFDTNSQLIFSRVAVWSTNSSGDVQGLISVSGSEEDGIMKNRLVCPPPLKGWYIHKDEMTEEQYKRALTQAKIKENSSSIAPVAT